MSNIFKDIRDKNIKNIKKYFNEGGDKNIRHRQYVNIYTNSIETDTYTLLTYALSSFRPYYELIKLLLDEKCDPNSQNSFNGNVPLHYVRKPKLMKLLIEHGAKLNICNKRNQTPVQNLIDIFSATIKFYAEKRIIKDVFKCIVLLMKYGCKLEDKKTKFIKSLYSSNSYYKHKKWVDNKLDQAFKIRYSRKSLLKLYVYYIKKHKSKYKNKLKLLNKDLRKLINS